ncbi:MAG: RsmB/NOP family class I SAM-dependent RNA methyltransferase [Paracoccaceae bacterium]
MAETDPKGLIPRAAAWAALRAVMDEGALLSDATFRDLAPDARARALRLASETLRQMGRADRRLDPHLRKPPTLGARMLLRMAVVEMAQGAAPHGVVDAAVTLLGRDPHLSRLKGLANAVLRKVDVSDWDKLPIPTLPRWLRRPLVDAWGQREVQRMEDAHLRGAALDLTARGDPGELAQMVDGTVLPTGSVRLDGRAQVTALPGHDAGAFWVQDAAAAIPARMLAPQPGEAVLDMCAAPGGKTLQMAAVGARVTALDLSGPRLRRVADNLRRTGLEAELIEGDALTFERGGWSAILLDAPCSATGTIRRHPDLPHARDGAEIGALIELQAALIDHAVSLLAPGGRLMACTCSLIPDEGEVQIEAALARHPGLTVDAAARDLPGISRHWHSPEGGVRTRPDHWEERGGLDGFHMALLRAPA